MSNPGLGSFSEGQKVGKGRFTLVRFIGQGTLTTVWLAHDAQLKQDVALKFLVTEFATNAAVLDALRRDILAASYLTHPNIIRTHGFFETPGETPFVAVEYVDGATFATIKAQRENRLFFWDELRPFVQQLCSALQFAHAQQVIHRDLKPSNLMLDTAGQLKVGDFCIADAINTATGRLSIKNKTVAPTYVSPQQLKGEKPHLSDDIYSFGATFYELVTSLPPFATGDLTYQVLHKQPLPVSQRMDELKLNILVDPDAGDMLLSCLAKEPARRPATFAKIAKWAFPSTIGEPEQELPPQRSQTPWQWFKVAFLLLLVAGGGGWYWWKFINTAPASIPWTVLFNGTTTEQWRGRDSDTFPSDSWRVDEGWLKPVPGSGPIARSSLITKERFKDFELEFDYVVAPRGNSGLLYGLGNPTMDGDAAEFNLLDDASFAPQAVRSSFERSGALTGFLEPTAKSANLAGQTNTARLVVSGGNVQHWINGVIVLSYNWNNPELRSTVTASPKGKTMGALLNSEAGHIALKNEEGVVSFRNIRIRRLE